MTVDLQTIPYQIHDFFIEPFSHGVYNVRDGLIGSRVELIRQNALNPVAQERKLSLAERVTACVIGLLLLVPIINTVVLMLLRSFENNPYVYPSQNTSITIPSTEEPVEEPESIQACTVSMDPITPEAMLQRKRDVLTRLTAIENMVTRPANALNDLKARFEPNARILNFDLERLLRRYRTNYPPSKLLEFMNWAGVDSARSNSFGRVVSSMDHASREDLQRTTVQKLLSYIAKYFVLEKARVGSGTPAETALKDQFNRVCDSIIDASNNCIDQTLSQLQSLILDVVAEGDSNRSGGQVQNRLFNLAGLALCKYRTNLLKEILVRQNPRERHMADLERVATQKVAEVLGMQGGIFTAGARYATVVDSIEARVDQAVNTFIVEYKPMEYLLKELRTYHGEARSLRAEILLFTRDYYKISEETNDILPDGSAPPNIDARMSEEFAALPCSEGGNFTLPAVALLLEASGLINGVPRLP